MSVVPKNFINPILFIKNEASNIGLLYKTVLWQLGAVHSTSRAVLPAHLYCTDRVSR